MIDIIPGEIIVFKVESINEAYIGHIGATCIYEKTTYVLYKIFQV